MIYPIDSWRTDDLVTVEYRGEILKVNRLLDEPPCDVEKYEKELNCYFVIVMREHWVGTKSGVITYDCFMRHPRITYDCFMRHPRPGSADFVISAHSIRELCRFIEDRFITGPQYIECEEPMNRNVNWYNNDKDDLRYVPFEYEERWRFGADGKREKYRLARF